MNDILGQIWNYLTHIWLNAETVDKMVIRKDKGNITISNGNQEAGKQKDVAMKMENIKLWTIGFNIY